MAWEQYSVVRGKSAQALARIESSGRLVLTANSTQLMDGWTHISAWYDADTGAIMLRRACEESQNCLRISRQGYGSTVSMRGFSDHFGITRPRSFQVAAVEDGLLFTPKT